LTSLMPDLMIQVLQRYISVGDFFVEFIMNDTVQAPVCEREANARHVYKNS
jgi:hypothetical protein